MAATIRFTLNGVANDDDAESACGPAPIGVGAIEADARDAASMRRCCPPGVNDGRCHGAASINKQVRFSSHLCNACDASAYHDCENARARSAIMRPSRMRAVETHSTSATAMTTYTASTTTSRAYPRRTLPVTPPQ